MMMIFRVNIVWKQKVRKQKVGELGETQIHTDLKIGLRYVFAVKTWNKWVLR